MTTTYNSERVQLARQQIIDRLGRLSLAQLEHLLCVISSLEAAETEATEPAGGEAFVARMRALRDEFHVTDEEFDEFDRTLRESDDAERRRMNPSSHE